MGVNDPPGEFLAWDSEFFGVRIGRVTAPRLDAEAFARVDEWRRSQTLDCIYCLVDPGDRVSIRTAETQGFRLVDLRVDLRRSFAGAAPLAASREPRPAAESDIPVLTSIARAAHRDSRFFFDERFDPARAEDLFATWIEKSCRGWADRVFVLESDAP
ncbi:MAG TPA: hypothetical protein VLV48_05890, partial [Thermoanaerobaculia bacterium]|nr:hypothetical protein [Thermoanaerobaculia bacterium]